MPATARSRKTHARRLSPAKHVRPTPPSIHTAMDRSHQSPQEAQGRSHKPLSLSEGAEVSDEGRTRASSSSTGPRTPEGKAISARNATTHGLFCRQTVLPQLGEDPRGYQALLDALSEQFDPRTPMERQYLELWAEASWKLRRLSRFEADVWEDGQLDRETRLRQLERLTRLGATLRRQLDKAAHMLSRGVPEAQDLYARRHALAARGLTEADCRRDPDAARRVEAAARADVLGTTVSGLDRSRLDTTPETENCRNEPPAQASPAPSEREAGGPPPLFLRDREGPGEARHERGEGMRYRRPTRSYRPMGRRTPT